MTEAKRRLAAILAADVAGYSRLMAADERATMDTLNAYREVFRDHVSSHDGRVVDTAGDSVLAVFDSVVEAVQCAREVQDELANRNAELAEARRMRFRIGVNAGDIIEQGDGTVYGDGVNVAARLEGLAAPDGVVVSESAHMQLQGKTDLTFDDIGAHEVKNIDAPVRAFAVRLGGAPATTAPRRAGRKIGLGVAAAVVLILIGLGAGYLTVFDGERADEIASEEPVAPAAVERMAYPLPDEPSIAVLPFDNLSGEPEHEFIADGLTENIISTLAQARNLLVIARNSTFIYKGKAVDIRAVAEEQSVRYVLEGSIQVSGETMRVTAQLIDAVDGVHVWAERYQRPLEDLFAVQDEITLQIVNAMQVELISGESAETMYGGTTDLEVWVELQKAIALAYQFSPQTNLRARAGFQRVLEREPNNTTALVWLGWTYSWAARVFGSETYEADLTRSIELAHAVIDSNPNLPDAYGLLAVGQHIRGETEQALEHANFGVEIAPNHGNIMLVASAVHYYAGQYERANLLLERAERLTPVPDVLLLLIRTVTYNALGNYDAAAIYAQRVIEILPAQNNPGHRELLFALVRGGKIDQARDLAAQILAVDPDYSTEAVRTRDHRCCRREPALMDQYVAALNQVGIP